MVSLFHRLFQKPKPVPKPESDYLKCRGCGLYYHKSYYTTERMMGVDLTGHCPECIGAT